MAFLASAAMAADQPVNDIFKVEGVQVDITADSALAARDQALDKAQIDAFKTLAGRMLPEAQAASFTPPDINTVSSMVKDYEVTSEKLSSVRYIGTYTITFRQSAVEKFFNSSGVSYTNAVSKPVVILPFLQVNGQTFLWSSYNIWLKAWNRTGGQGAPAPVIVPIGDIEDVGDVSDDEVFSYKPEKLQRLLSRYDAGEAVIALATPGGNQGRIAEGDQPRAALNVSLYRTDRGQPENVQEIVVETQSGDTMAMLMDRAVARAQAALKSNWKDKTAVNPTSVTQNMNTLIARVKINSLEDWANTQKTLRGVSAVTGATLKSLTPREAMVEIGFRGDEDMLRSALAQAGMELSAPKYVAGGYNGSPTASRLVYELYMQGMTSRATVTEPASYGSGDIQRENLPPQNAYQPPQPQQQQPYYQRPDRVPLIPQSQIRGQQPVQQPLTPPPANNGYVGQF